MKIGDIVYHGTSAKEDFDIPDGPAWFSHSRSVAEHFRGYHTGPRPRILKFLVIDEPELFLVESHSDFAYLMDDAGLDYDGDYAGDVEDLVEAVDLRGFDGWDIPHNYPDGDDIMLLEPKEWVELIEVIE